MDEQPPEAHGAIAAEPAIDGIGVTRFQQAVASNRVGRHAIGNFEHGGTTLAEIRTRVVVAMVEQAGALVGM